MDVKFFAETLGADFYTGVPDSQLKALCSYLMERYGIDPAHHLIAANEGNCLGLAAGYHLATGRAAVVYMQNSGEGNVINPLASLLHKKVYGIPVIFVIGWRGEPGVHDEPQHIYQGEITETLMEVMGVSSAVIDQETTEEELKSTMKGFSEVLDGGGQVAFIVRKNALKYTGSVKYSNSYQMTREAAIELVVSAAGEDMVISTTGKASRELFELRERLGEGHGHDFLTVGSMGHSSSIALGVALQKPDRRVWCIDGDGAALMHLGALALVGSQAPKNFVHVLINNEAHESVGGMPTAAGSVDFPVLAGAVGYKNACSVKTPKELERVLEAVGEKDGPTFIEVKCAIGAREDLGRPTTTPEENKRAFMDTLGV
ncbi:MAG: phosphonopyruvate decarboxylase [Lachnospiraceae bacterium]|nr:phosphonopyruvate decarboxylase [Lachnospiraceae bacterium]